MPGGPRDSSLTRVAPVFDALSRRPDDWPRRLLALAQFGALGGSVPEDLDMSFLRGCWGGGERGLDPPLSLLSWLIRHPQEWASEADNEQRRLLESGDPPTVELALASLRLGHPDRDWFILEGRTFPDAFIETPGALIVVEGKRTESGPTTHTKWMPGRHQIWRHIDAAWEIRGRRQVYGLFIVEGGDEDIPQVWAKAARDTVAEAALLASFPHRSSDEVAQLRCCFRGVTTWDRVCREFSIDKGKLPDTTGGRAPN
jgi:hypothetical protein